MYGPPRVVRRVWRQKDANGRTVIFPGLTAFNLDPAPMAFNGLLGHKQANACAHGAASSEGFKHSGQLPRFLRSAHIS